MPLLHLLLGCISSSILVHIPLCRYIFIYFFMPDLSLLNIHHFLSKDTVHARVLFCFRVYSVCSF